MASFTLEPGPFPAGTTVGVYPHRALISSSSGPVGVLPITTGVTGSDMLTTFSSLSLGYGTKYTAAAAVNGTWRRVLFTTDPEPDLGDLADLEAAVAGVDLRLILVEGPAVYLPPPSGVEATDTAALVTANAAAVAAGGGTIFGTAAPESDPYLTNAAVEISSAPPVNLRGVSKDGTIFKLTTAGARLRFGAGGGGESGDFSVHGGTYASRVANVGIECGLFNQRSFRNIDVRYTTQHAWLRLGTQNTAWHNCTAYDHDGNGFTSDGEAGANHHYNCGASNCLGYAISYRQTVALEPSIGLIQPSYDHWWGGVFERPFGGVHGAPGTHASGLVSHSAGVHTTFHGTQFSLAGITSAMSVLTMSLDASPATFSAELVLDDCEYSGDGTMTHGTIARLTHAQNNLRIRGRCVPAGFATGFAVVDGARVYVETSNWDDDPAYVTTWASKISGSTPVEQLVQREPKFRYGSKTWNPASLATGFADFTTVTVQDAEVGDVADPVHSSFRNAHMVLQAQVTSPGTVTVTLFNAGGATEDVASGTLAVSVRKH